MYCRPSQTPAIAIRLPFVLLQCCTSEDGIHFIAMKQNSNQGSAIQFERATHLGYAGSGYHWGYFINILGVVMAVLPKTTGDIDYIVSPYVALVLPYWLLIIGTGFLLVTKTSTARWISPFCRPSKVSGIVAVIICLFFLLMNFIPSAGRPGAKIKPQTFHDWITLTLEPETTYSDIMLVYGFPFPCYRKDIINGQTVNLYHGAELGWKPHKAMENICVALFSAFIIICIVQLLRQFGVKSQEKQTGKSDMLEANNSELT
jgi:hypothetical protein